MQPTANERSPSAVANESRGRALRVKLQFVALIKAETERWGEVVKASGFKPMDS